MTGPAAASDCRLALMLALDISSSVDPAEDALQRGGMAAALTDGAVSDAFLGHGPVALAVFEWSGRYNQELLVDWTMIDTPAALARVAQTIANSRRSYAEFPTAMGAALVYAAELFAQAPDCRARTLDVSGDGENNEGPGPQLIYAQPAFGAITVNGLAIANAAEFQTAISLVAFYRETLRHGPGAFVIVADGFEDFARAMRLKLLRELAPPVLGALPATGDAG